MKNKIHALVTFSLLFSLLSACSFSKRILSSDSVHKRKYQSHEYVQVVSHKQPIQLPEPDKQVANCNEQTKAQQTESVNNLANDKVVAQNTLLEEKPSALDASQLNVVSDMKNLYCDEKPDIRAFQQGYKKIKKGLAEKITSGIKTKIAAKIDSDPKKWWYNVASFFISLIGLLVAGAICGALAIILGATGVAEGNVKVLGIIGIIVGIFDVVWVWLYIASL
ncbi:MAG: hypothetical protein KKA07_12570 [Bacteroidetes bacterium]|nr:hypothetical protein [Bacteroidota bacterium]MBU1719892.1 hypothetical protein [Bacteroidota bacterium]